MYKIGQTVYVSIESENTSGSIWWQGKVESFTAENITVQCEYGQVELVLDNLKVAYGKLDDKVFYQLWEELPAECNQMELDKVHAGHAIWWQEG